MIQMDSQSAGHAEVPQRVFDVAGKGMQPPLAESILGLDFSDSDSQRIAELNEKANEGTLNEDEQAELEAFISIGDLLELWRLKARKVLQSRA